MKQFPKDFLWGVSISSYQTEGNNFNSDWYAWEQKGKTKDKSENACDYWNRFRSDHDFLSELGVNAFRLSLEWSRIEPEEGKFSDEAIRHYREIIQDLKSRNIKTVVTFWHYTSPIWFQEKYGFHKKEAIEIFSRYGKKITDDLGDLIDVAVIINEPVMPLIFGFLLGKFPPGKINPVSFLQASSNLAESYIEIFKYIKEKRKNIPVGVSNLYNFFEPKNKRNPIHKLWVWAGKKIWNEHFISKIKNHMDYFGLDYYFHNRMGCFGTNNENKRVTEMGWEIYPEGIYAVLKEINQKYKLPVYILENGIADSQDKQRSEFIEDHVACVRKAIEDGVDVRGYFYWSLMDNFEWLHGYRPRFGLIEIDYKTLERKPRRSFYAYKKIIENNGLDE